MRSLCLGVVLYYYRFMYIFEVTSLTMGPSVCEVTQKDLVKPIIRIHHYLFIQLQQNET